MKKAILFALLFFGACHPDPGPPPPTDAQLLASVNYRNPFLIQGFNANCAPQPPGDPVWCPPDQLSQGANLQGIMTTAATTANSAPTHTNIVDAYNRGDDFKYFIMSLPHQAFNVNGL